eukprot:Seg1254.3 transcript_id=Seg1254.3/GoldUCD/mRNA.D3Y31 product="hypothetical protein" protein_id=Seg1254.3/GoldUCD/D3Y31
MSENPDYERQRKHSVDGNENVGFETSSTDLNQSHHNKGKSDGHKHEHEHSKVALGKLLSLRNRESGAFHFEDGKHERNENEIKTGEDSGKIMDGNNSTTVSNNTFEAVAMEEENEMEAAEIVPYDIAERQLEKGRDIDESDNEDISGLAKEDCAEEFGDTEIYPYPDIYLTKVDCDHDDSVEIEVILSSNSPGSGARKYQGGRFIGEVARSMKGRRKKHSEAESVKESSDEGLNAEKEISEKRREGISQDDLSERNNVPNETQSSDAAVTESLNGSSRTQEDSNKRNETVLIDSLSNTHSEDRNEIVESISENPKESLIDDGENSSGTRTEKDGELRMVAPPKDRDGSESDSCDSEVETSTGDEIIADRADRNKKPILPNGDRVLGTNARDINTDEQEQRTVEFDRENQSSEDDDPGEETSESDENDSESDNEHDKENEQESGDNNSDNSDGLSENECNDEAESEEHSEESDDSDNDETDDELEDSSENDSESGNEECEDSEVDNEDDFEGTVDLRHDKETDIKPTTDAEIGIENIRPDTTSFVGTRSSSLETPLQNDIQVTLIDDMPPVLNASDTKKDGSTSTSDKNDAFRVI